MSYNEEFNEQNQQELHNNSKNQKKGRKIGKILGIIALLIVTNIGTAFFVSNFMIVESTKIESSVDDKNGIAMNSPKISLKSDIDEDEIQKFRKLFVVKKNLEKHYNGEIDDDILVEGAIKGMTNALQDPYTVYMNEKEFEYLTTETEGSYIGLGIQVGVIENKIVIIAPFEDSPAKEAGILSGDIIQKVNGVEVLGTDLEKAVNMMKGKKGRKVDLTLFREGEGTLEITVVADEIKLHSVQGEMIDDEIGYIQLFMFDENSADDVKKQLDELKKQGMKSLILDLRGNPGGLVSQCADIASNFIPKGKTIVYTIDKNNKKYPYTSKGGQYTDLPIVILTDGGTASASEILSGALRDYNRATLIGTKTFGKGLVQSVLYRSIDGFGDGTALKVTVSNYYTPNGENINKKGIMPHIEIEYPQELLEEDYDRELDSQFQKALETAKEKLSEE